MADTAPAPAAETSCCSAFYEQDWVRLLAQDCFHPGGADLTRRTLAAMGLPAGASLLDLGCGTGTTAGLVAAQGNLQVTGIDRSADNVARATDRVPGARFVRGDVQAMPFGAGAFDGALCECVFSLMPDKAAALREIRRVLAPGGRLGLTDMALGGTLPRDLAEVVAPWTCLADALSPAAYVQLFEEVGFTVTEVADESAGLTQLIGGIKRRLLLVGAGALLGGDVVAKAGAAPADYSANGGGTASGEGATTEGRGHPTAIDLGEVKHWLNRCRDEVSRGTVRYLRFQLTRAGD